MTPRQISYQEYLKTEHWKQLRHSVLSRDGFRCTRCLSRCRLQAHHLIYRDKFEDSIPTDLTTLCRRCHKLEHGISNTPAIKKSRVIPLAKHRISNEAISSWKELQHARCVGLISREQYVKLRPIFKKPKQPRKRPRRPRKQRHSPGSIRSAYESINSSRAARYGWI